MAVSFDVGDVSRRCKHVDHACPHPKELRDDAVAVARRGDVPIAHIAKDFVISEPCLPNWLLRADVEDGVKPGVTTDENAENRDLEMDARCLEHETEVLRRAAVYLSQANLKLGQSPT